MPEWFYPLMLVVILAGYVFLFIQGRIIRRSQEEILGDVDRLETAVRGLAERPEPRAQAMPVAASIPPPPPAPALDAGAVAEELEPRIRQVLQSLDQQGEVLDLLRRMVEDLQKDVRAAGARPAPANLSPEELARHFLIGEGFSRIHLTGSDLRDGGIRFLVRAMRGDEVRQGHVMVKGDQVVDAALKAPSALFP